MNYKTANFFLMALYQLIILLINGKRVFEKPYEFRDANQEVAMDGV